MDKKYHLKEKITFENILLKLEPYKNDLDMDMVKKAYAFAANCHRGQTRKSGEAYICHPLRVLDILLSMRVGVDNSMVCAALLHDVLEDKKEITAEIIKKEFNEDIAFLVTGVTKVDRLEFKTEEEYRNDSRKKIIEALSKDVRIILLKLADRLHNMQTLGSKEPERIKAIARETLDTFVPMANILGAYRIKSELEDLCLRYLDEDNYKKIVLRQKAFIRRHKEEYLLIHDCIRNLLKEKEGNIVSRKSEVKVRYKNTYGLYRNISNSIRIKDMLDFTSIRIVVEDVEECYKVNKLICDEFVCVEGSGKDYIENPKSNGYQSLHTTIRTNKGTFIQIQIRTHEMDRVADNGVPAYGYIAKGIDPVKMNDDLHRLMPCFKALAKLEECSLDPFEYVEEAKDLICEEISVYTPKSKEIKLPEGSTVVDFAYKVHTGVGNTMIGALVNAKEVAINYVLKSGDTIEVITDVNALGPSEEWLDMAKTSYARKRIRLFLNKGYAIIKEKASL